MRKGVNILDNLMPYGNLSKSHTIYIPLGFLSCFLIQERKYTGCYHCLRNRCVSQAWPMIYITLFLSYFLIQERKYIQGNLSASGKSIKNYAHYLYSIDLSFLFSYTREKICTRQSKCFQQSIKITYTIYIPSFIFSLHFLYKRENIYRVLPLPQKSVRF